MSKNQRIADRIHASVLRRGPTHQSDMAFIVQEPDHKVHKIADKDGRLEITRGNQIRLKRSRQSR